MSVRCALFRLNNETLSPVPLLLVRLSFFVVFSVAIPLFVLAPLGVLGIRYDSRKSIDDRRL